MSNTEQGAFAPVTEGEVMSFAQRIATTLVSYSQQAEELHRLRDIQRQTLQEFDRMRQDNAQLRRDVQAATELATQAERDKTEWQRQAEEAKSAAKALQDAMIGRDATVSELRQKLNAVENERDSAVREADSRMAENERLKESLNHWKSEAERLSHDLAEANRERAKLNSDLSTIREAHAKVFAAMGMAPTPPATPPVEYTPEPPKAEVQPEMKPVVPEDQPEEPTKPAPWWDKK